MNKLNIMHKLNHPNVISLLCVIVSPRFSPYCYVVTPKMTCESSSTL